MKLTIRNPQEAFENAIHRKVLSSDEQSPKYAGEYMYMYTGKDGTDYFKNRHTRKYIECKNNQNFR